MAGATHQKKHGVTIMLSGKFTSIFAILCSIVMADYSSGSEKKTAVVNAGSTGSRLYIYEHSSNPGSGLPVIEKQTSSKQKGGIQDVDADNLETYLKNLFSAVNKENINNIYFYSTAGMRQAEPDKKASLNEGIERWLKAEFPSSDIDVQIITGREEALYNWLALNYDNKLLKFQGKTEGVLDMGGASTQIAYEVDDNANFIVQINSKTYKLNTESFLGLGLDVAINQYLDQPECFPKDFTLPNRKKGTGDFDACSEAIAPLITGVQKVHNYITSHPAINTCNFLLVAGFNYTASELNISKSYSIANLGKKGRDFCEQSWKDLKSGKTSYLATPFLWHICFDAALEKDLLTLGYRINLGGVPIKTASSMAYKSDWTLGVLLKSFVTAIPEPEEQHKPHTDL
ncbi:hypothetical protein [Endozoicomonas lisbonensis]